MKKTAIYKQIDGHKVVMGFSDATIDPVATNLIVNEAIKDTDEWQAAEAKKAEYADAIKALNAARAARDETAYRDAMGAMSVRQVELKPIAADLDAKITALRYEKAVYFEPRAGEVILDASQIETLTGAFKDISKGTLITLDGSAIEDNRGVKFYRKPKGGKWGKTEIVKLGDKVPGDAKFESDITEGVWDEIEADRVSGLTVPQRDLDKSACMNDAINAAADMRSRLEIQSDPDALAKSKESYEVEVARVVKLYG